MRLEDLAVIGNCQYSALVDRRGSVVWCCLPRFDSEPVFGELLDPDGGSFVIAPADGSAGVQRYVDNTNIIETRFDTPDGAFRVLDFAPRFAVHERMFRPTKIVRVVEPLSGTPRVVVRCDPRLGWSRAVPRRELGSHHIRYQGFDASARLTTDVPLSYVEQGSPFALTGRKHFVFAWGEPVEEPLPPLCERFLRETERYWRGWVKHCNVPAAYQREVIRSALALKLHCFEDTGAIVAAMTTSVPESHGTVRNWDYRYCWLRDGYYALDAFRLLGHFEEREQFLEYLLNVAGSSTDLNLAPLYRVDGRSDLDERELPNWAGFEGHGPVRVGNGAATHLQHDVFGEMVLALSPVFLDERFGNERTPATLELLKGLARKAVSVVGQPDASIWELRTEWTPQTFSSLMCWAAADRVGRIVERHEPLLVGEFRGAAERIRDEIFSKAWSGDLGSLVSSYGGLEFDASLLQAVTLRFLPPGDPRTHSTLDAIVKHLGQGTWLRRYRTDDGFGVPSVAFIICTFWLVEALALSGRVDEARAALARTTEALSPVGLLAEDWDPVGRRLWGNFPQAYSHVGLIHAAFAASPSWYDVL